MRFSSLLEFDARLSQKIRIAEKPGKLRLIAAFLAHSGDSWFWGTGLLLLWIVGSASWKKWAAVAFFGIAILAALVLGIKFTVKRKRPEGEWGLLYRSTDPHSFPSGHAARAFLLPVLTWGAGPLWLAILLAVWAPLVALARVAMGVHYVSDILAGALLGLFMGGLVLAVYPEVFSAILSLVG